MRLSTTVLLGLTIFGTCSGCTMFGNPLARTDPAEAARERHAAEVSALIARGDYEGAQRLIDSARNEISPTASSASDQTHALRSEAERERMINQLLASQPDEWRDMLRQKYAQLSTPRLEELVAKDRELRGIGQRVVPDPTIPTLAQDPSIQLAGNRQNAGQSDPVTQAQRRVSGHAASDRPATNGFGIGFPQLDQNRDLHAPDPRPQGAGADRPAAASSGAPQEAPRLPDSVNSQVSQAGHQGQPGPGSIQTVAGTSAHNAAHSGAFAPTGPDAGQLPQIIPGNRELYSNETTGRGSPANPFPQGTSGARQGAIQPMAGYSAQSAPSNGGVALENRIEIDSGTVSGSAASQAAAGSRNPFPVLSPPTGTGQVTGPPENGAALSGIAPSMSQSPPTSQNGVPAGQPGPSADQSLIPGVIRGGYESIRNATATVTEHGLRTFGAIGPDGTRDPGPKPAAAPAAATIDDLISSIEAQLARTAPGNTELERLNHVRRQVNLRMLYLIADRIDQSIEPISAADPADQEFWQQLFFAYVNYFDAQQMPQASDRATQTIDQLRTAIARLRHRADLKLKNVTFCHHIVSFGDYERFSTDQFTPGQPLLLYAEVENFFSTRTDADRYRTVLKSQIEIYDNSNMQNPVVTIPFDPSEDICRNHRRDFFHSYEFTVPQDLQPGLYTLVLRVTDQLSQKVATSRLNFSVE